MEGSAKQFDEWNEKKKGLDVRTHIPRVRIREVWWCHLGLNVGDEQDGTGTSFLRPVLILRVFNEKVVFVIPATSARKTNRYFYPIQFRDRDGSLILSQARLISTARLHDRMLDERISVELFGKIRKAFKDLF